MWLNSRKDRNITTWLVQEWRVYMRDSLCVDMKFTYDEAFYTPIKKETKNTNWKYESFSVFRRNRDWLYFVVSQDNIVIRMWNSIEIFWILDTVSSNVNLLLDSTSWFVSMIKGKISKFLRLDLDEENPLPYTKS